MSAMQRRKGAAGELEAIELLRANGWPRAHRNFGSGSAGGCDVARGPAGFAIEVKRVNRLELHRALDQAREGCGPTDAPLVLTRRDRGPWLAILEAEDLLPLIAARETR